jgi:hypothetical protein
LTKIIGSAALAPGGDSGTDLTNKGDLHGYSSSNTRIPVGSNDTVLTADSSEALGVKWAAAGGAGDLEILSDSELGADGTSLVYTPSSALNMETTYGELYVIVQGWVATAASIGLKINDHTDYDENRIMNDSATVTGAHLDANSTFELVNSAIGTNGDLFSAICSIKRTENGEGSVKMALDASGGYSVQGNQITQGYDVTTIADSEIDKIEIESSANMDKGVRLTVWGRKV